MFLCFLVLSIWFVSSFNFVSVLLYFYNLMDVFVCFDLIDDSFWGFIGLVRDKDMCLKFLTCVHSMGLSVIWLLIFFLFCVQWDFCNY